MRTGHGRRDCVGRALATKELYIVLGKFLLRYEIGLTEKGGEIRRRFGVTTSIEPTVPLTLKHL